MKMSIPSYPTVAGISENLDRINALYSPFRQRSLNPEHHDQKLKFWVKSVEEYCAVDKRATFTIKELETAFKVQNRVSACFPDVISYLRTNGSVVTEEEYLGSLNSASDGWLSWSTKPLRYAASTLWKITPLGSLTQKQITKTTRLLYLPQLTSHAATLQSHPDVSDKLMTMEEWREKVTQLISPPEIDLFFKYFQATGALAQDKLGETELVKLAASGTKPVITQAEKGVFDVTRTKDKLEKELETVFTKQKQAENQARLALKEGQRITAKHHLKSKKLYEKRCEKLCGLIDNLTVILFQIEESQSDARILAAYEAGKKALGKVLEENNINVDRVTDVMLDLQEALEDQAEVSMSIGKGIVDEDTTMLEKELEELMNLEEEPSFVSTREEIKAADESASDVLGKLDKLSLEGLDDLTENSKGEKSPTT